MIGWVKIYHRGKKSGGDAGSNVLVYMRGILEIPG